MSDPRSKDKVEIPDEDYVSPTSDETINERYKRVRAEETAMNDEDRAKQLAKLRKPSELFDDINEEETA